jgi:hypothetical protein
MSKNYVQFFKNFSCASHDIHDMLNVQNIEHKSVVIEENGRLVENILVKDSDLHSAQNVLRAYEQALHKQLKALLNKKTPE